MATDILPHKALNDIGSMHYYLKQKVTKSKHTTDLIPFINQLIDIEDLKRQIIASLDKQYQKENSLNSTPSEALIESKSNLRSLFLSIFALNGIPSDIIHANIISFLPSKEYKKLPILSKHFRNVMINNPFIFNDKGYVIDLKFCNKNHSLNKLSEIQILHENQTVVVQSVVDENTYINIAIGDSKENINTVCDLFYNLPLLLTHREKHLNQKHFNGGSCLHHQYMHGCYSI